jgi:hypothetical protein
MTDRRKKLRARRDRAFLAKVIKAGSIHRDELTDLEWLQAQRLHRSGCIKAGPWRIKSRRKVQVRLENLRRVMAALADVDWSTP